MYTENPNAHLNMLIAMSLENTCNTPIEDLLKIFRNVRFHYNRLKVPFNTPH
jgi:hypothetical protein